MYDECEYHNWFALAIHYMNMNKQLNYYKFNATPVNY